MPLNENYWNLWKQSDAGKASIRLFEEGTVEDIFEKHLGISQIEVSDAAAFVGDLVECTTKPEVPEELLDEQAGDFFNLIADEGIMMNFEDEDIDINDTSELLNNIPEISTWLYLLYPDFYRPYFFRNNFYHLTRIAESFGLKLPTVPLKSKKTERLKYYWKLCESFLDFQKQYKMTPAEFCAFLYDFAPNDIKQNDPKTQGVLPEPTQIWMIGGKKRGGDFEFLDNLSESSTSFWQGNENTKKGDVLVMYCLAPYSYIHSIWRATTDGIADPFFHWYGSIYIAEGQKVIPISLNELKSDPHFSQHKLVRKNLQGVNGYQLEPEDYIQLQKMITDKGGEIAHLPKLYGYSFDKNRTLKNEQEVNSILIEPLLINLDYTSTDWVKELQVSMGRGEKTYADYAFPVKGKKGNENVSMLVESKFHIKNKRDMEDAFRQVKSYGKRLLAMILIIADKDFIWIYQRQKDYDFDSTQFVKKPGRKLRNLTILFS